MTNIIINTDLCKGCGKCSKDCPVQIIKIENGKAKIPEELKSNCLQCGHCQSICSSQAISIFNLPNEKLNQKPETLIDIIKYRRSIRNFKEESIPIEKLKEIIQIAKYSPSACNFRPMKFLIVNRPKLTEKLNELINYCENHPECSEYVKYVCKMQKEADFIARGAPHVLIAYCEEKWDMWGLDDATIMLTQIELVLSNSGYGSLWLGCMRYLLQTPGSMEIFGLKGYKCYGAFAIGIPNVHYSNLISREDVDISVME